MRARARFVTIRTYSLCTLIARYTFETKYNSKPRPPSGTNEFAVVTTLARRRRRRRRRFSRRKTIFVLFFPRHFRTRSDPVRACIIINVNAVRRTTYRVRGFVYLFRDGGKAAFENRHVPIETIIGTSKPCLKTGPLKPTWQEGRVCPVVTCKMNRDDERAHARRFVKYRPGNAICFVNFFHAFSSKSRTAVPSRFAAVQCRKRIVHARKPFPAGRLRCWPNDV